MPHIGFSILLWDRLFKLCGEVEVFQYSDIADDFKNLMASFLFKVLLWRNFHENLNSTFYVRLLPTKTHKQPTNQKRDKT